MIVAKKVYPVPTDAPPGTMPFVRETIARVEGLENSAATFRSEMNATDKGLAASIQLLTERLGEVQDIMDTIGSSLTIDASQVVSGTFNVARIPNHDANKITSGTLTRPIASPSDITVTGSVTATGNGTFNNAWNYDVSALTRRAVWMDSAGTMGQTASSRRFKKDITTHYVDPEIVLSMRTVKFHWRPEVGADNYWEYGLIAEELDALGLKWLVSYEDDGVTPHSVHYDRVVVALIDTVKDTYSELQSIRERVEVLENAILDKEGF